MISSVVQTIFETVNNDSLMRALFPAKAMIGNKVPFFRDFPSKSPEFPYCIFKVTFRSGGRAQCSTGMLIIDFWDYNLEGRGDRTWNMKQRIKELFLPDGKVFDCPNEDALALRFRYGDEDDDIPTSKEGVWRCNLVLTIRAFDNQTTNKANNFL